MRWFQINKNATIFNLTNITHFKAEPHNDTYRVVAYFNFSSEGGGVGVGAYPHQHRGEIGFSGKQEVCKQVIKAIIEGKYDVA